MKLISIIVCLSTLICFSEFYGQTDSTVAGPEYNILNVFTGRWDIQLKARDSLGGEWYNVDWTLTGKRILKGYCLENTQVWKDKHGVFNGIEIDSYDPLKKIWIAHIVYDDGSWLNSTPTFIDSVTCIENGTTNYPNGRVEMWRDTWNFSSDLMLATVKCEDSTDHNWWVTFEGKGIRKKQ